MCLEFLASRALKGLSVIVAVCVYSVSRKIERVSYPHRLGV